MSIEETLRRIVQEAVREELSRLELAAPVDTVPAVDYPAVMTSRQVADFLGCSRQRVYQLFHSGELKGKRHGRTYRFRKEWVLDWLKPTETSYQNPSRR